MPRRILVETPDGPVVALEVLAHDEAQLHVIMKDHPELLPLDDLGLVGPPLVVGRETTLPSGSIDLCMLARGGEVVLVEFKTGPQNPDFRAALAQLLDYGSDLWEMTYDDFEKRVAFRYFASSHAKGTSTEGCKSIGEAMKKVWGDAPLTEEEEAAFKERLVADLSDGRFTYIVAAQRFTDAMGRTAQYLNASQSQSSFCLVEMVRFERNDAEVFEARTILQPGPGRRSPKTSGSRLTRESLLEQIPGADYAEGIDRLLTSAEEMGLTIYWGTKGISIRVDSPTGRSAYASIAWLYPPGVIGWLNLTDLTLGFDPNAQGSGPIRRELEQYAETCSALPGAVKETKGGLVAWHFGPADVVNHLDAVTLIFDNLQFEMS